MHDKAHNADRVGMSNQGELAFSKEAKTKKKTFSLLICEPQVASMLLCKDFFSHFMPIVLFSDTCLEITLSFWYLVISHKSFCHF